MGDMQRSQTISTQNQGKATGGNRKPVQMQTGEGRSGNLPVLRQESSLQEIRRLAKANPDMVFTSLAHRIDPYQLEESFKAIRKSQASGVDEVTAKEYAVNLDANLYDLHKRLSSGQYVAQSVRRVWIDKEGGKKRPIGILALEDKIVQKAVERILNIVFEVNFYDFSYGFRSGYSAHMAIREIRQACMGMNINWIVDADVSGYFDNIEHALLKEFVKRRVNDGGIIRLIGKWLNAGVMEKGIVSYAETGTPQGGVISPVLANIFLHYVLDEWFMKEVRPRMTERCFLVRYADDFIVGFERESDARRFMAVLPKRFERYKLTIHPEKTKLVDFRKPVKSSKGTQGGTFNFLGFTHYWGKSRKGWLVVKRKTMSKRASGFLKRVWLWCCTERHKPVREQYQELSQKLRGHYQYYGVNGNFRSMKKVRWRCEWIWRYWLSRRSNKGGLCWDKFKGSILSKMELPRVRIVHGDV
ncbi:MAG: group II intron reverse transcriptase/maturase [Deltaproteobacteria bacterium]|nr:group II intron reverse transcriptase/maturase [Deltaproteobacteria bacterium]